MGVQPRCTNPLEPEYKVPTHATTSLHTVYTEEQGIAAAPKQADSIGQVHGSKPRKLQWDNGEPQFSLLREDIAGTVPQRWIGSVPANIYDPPDVRSMISFHDPHDIPGAQVGSLKKGIEGSTGRVLNPLNPKYPMLDGGRIPQPVPLLEAERGHPRPGLGSHPVLQRQAMAASSAPDLRAGVPPPSGGSRGMQREASQGRLRSAGEAVGGFRSCTPSGCGTPHSQQAYFRDHAVGDTIKFVDGIPGSQPLSRRSSRGFG